MVAIPLRAVTWSLAGRVHVFVLRILTTDARPTSSGGAQCLGLAASFSAPDDEIQKT